MIAGHTMIIRIITTLVLACTISSCNVTPDIPQSRVMISEQFRNQINDSSSKQRIDWWKNFNDTTLNTLIEKASIANHDINIAIERVNQARSGLTISDSQLYPTVDLTSSYSNSETGLPNDIKQINPDTESRRIAVEVGWELDIFGSTRARANSEQNDFNAARYGIAAAQLIVISETARHYFIWQGARYRLSLLESLISIQSESESLVQLRYEEGLASALELSQIKAETYKLTASLPPLKALIAATESQIAVLLGQSPSEPVTELTLSTVTMPVIPILATGQPADLLLRRPDVLIAEQQLAAASSRVVMAKANRFPKLFLSAVFGQQDLTLNNSINLSPSHYSNVAAAFVMPLFNAGRIQAGIDAQTSRQREALLHYDQTVIRAIGDVEASLSTVYYQKQKIDIMMNEIDQRQKSANRAAYLLAEGQYSRLQLNRIQSSVISTQLSLIENQTLYVIDAIGLYKALGGGWQMFEESDTGSTTITTSGEVS